MIKRAASRTGLVAGIVLGALLLLAPACGPTGQGATTTSSDAASNTSAFGGTSSSVPTALQATTVVEGLSVPWEMRFLSDGRLLVTEREGRVAIVDVTSGEIVEVGRIDVLARGEGGLMGLALDTDFPDPPYIYVSYTHDQTGDARNRVSRFVLDGLDGPVPRLGDETVLLDDIPGASIHNGSRTAFGPDGYLWVTTGDAADEDLAQELDSLAGKVLRMTKDGQAAPGNPFAGEPYPFSLIYTLGHRNPQGLAFHPVSGQVYVTEHGPADNDEINRLQAGGNYGWPDLGGKAGELGFLDPIATWSPTIAPAGALFYTGGSLAGLEGAFLFVTLKERDLRILVPVDDADFATVVEERILFDEEFGRLRAIAVGPDGYLYVSTSNLDGRGDPRSGDDRIIRIGP